MTNFNYKPCKLYNGGTKKNNYKPDLKKVWFVYYYYLHPGTGQYQRIVIKHDLNKYKTLYERNEYGQALINKYDKLLNDGLNPFEEFVRKQKAGELNTNIVSCTTLYLSEKKKSLAPKSYAPYSQHVGYFVKWLEEHNLDTLNIDEIKKSHIRQFISDYRDKSAAGNRQLNNIKDNIASFFSYFVKNFDEYIVKNPVTGIQDLPCKAVGNKAYTDKQLQVLKEIMQVENPSMLSFCEMVYESCTRPHEEARLLKIEDLEFNQNRIHITPELSKEGRSEYIPMSARYMDRLKEYVKGYPENYYLFSVYKDNGKSALRPGKTAVSEDTLQTWFKKIKQQAGFDKTYSIYSYKHSYCVRAYLDTKDVYFIQMKCRHADLTATCKYLRDLGLFIDLKNIADTVRSL